MTILAPRPVKRSEQARRLRERAIAVGVDPFVAGTTAADDLAAVIRLAPQLRLVHDADLDALDTPRLGVPLTPIQRMESEGFTPDEIASVLTFTRGMHIESGCLGADNYGPWDEYTPDGAA